MERIFEFHSVLGFEVQRISRHKTSNYAYIIFKFYCNFKNNLAQYQMEFLSQVYRRTLHLRSDQKMGISVSLVLYRIQCTVHTAVEKLQF